MMMMMMKTRGINWEKIITLPEEEGNSLSFFFLGKTNHFQLLQEWRSQNWFNEEWNNKIFLKFHFLETNIHKYTHENDDCFHVVIEWKWLNLTCLFFFVHHSLVVVVVVVDDGVDGRITMIIDDDGPNEEETKHTWIACHTTASRKNNNNKIFLARFFNGYDDNDDDDDHHHLFMVVVVICLHVYFFLASIRYWVFLVVDQKKRSWRKAIALFFSPLFDLHI